MNVYPVPFSGENIKDLSKNTPQAHSSTTQQVAELGLTLSSTPEKQQEFFKEHVGIQRKNGYLAWYDPRVVSMIDRLPMYVNPNTGEMTSLKNAIISYQMGNKLIFETKNITQPKIASPENALIEK